MSVDCRELAHCLCMRAMLVLVSSCLLRLVKCGHGSINLCKRLCGSGLDVWLRRKRTVVGGGGVQVGRRRDSVEV